MSDPRLLVPLEELPGFDATGLAVVRIHDSRNEHCIYDEGSEDTPEAFDCNLQTLGVDSDRARWHPRKLYAVSFAHTDTRDRAARWLGEREKLRLETTAPRFYWSDVDECWWLDVPSSDSRGYSALGKISRGERLIERVSALADIDQDDPAKLPDGSRVAHALALALVCQHVGRQA